MATGGHFEHHQDAVLLQAFLGFVQDAREDLCVNGPRSSLSNSVAEPVQGGGVFEELLNGL